MISCPQIEAAPTLLPGNEGAEPRLGIERGEVRVEAQDQPSIFRRFQAQVGHAETTILLGRGLGAALAEQVASLGPKRPVLIVADRGVPASARRKMLEALTASTEHLLIEVEGGEAVKTWSVLGSVLERALTAGCGRQSVVVGLGGGATTDLAALAAALLGRGAPVVLVPTTLLAQVDAALGGKCALNLGPGRNSVGCFHPARSLLVDFDFLDTLPPERIREGMAEVVKAGIIGSADLFEALRLGRGPTAEIVAQALELKAQVVARDPWEHGERKVLNLGHTLGHAVEAASRFQVSHGEAVAMGIAAVARFSRLQGWLPEAEEARIIATLEALGLPTTVPAHLRAECGAYIAHDKKGDDTTLDLIVVHAVGKVSIQKLSLDHLRTELVRCGGMA